MLDKEVPTVGMKTCHHHHHQRVGPIGVHHFPLPEEEVVWAEVDMTETEEAEVDHPSEEEEEMEEEGIAMTTDTNNDFRTVGNLHILLQIDHFNHLPSGTAATKVEK
jgi:hypothetical protein